MVVATSIITFTITVFGGTLVFFFSQLILKYLIEPINDYRRIRSQISINLVFYANIYSNLTEINEENMNNKVLVDNCEEVSSIFRKLASELIGVSNVIPLYKLFALTQIIPNRSSIKKVSSNLIGISNTLWAYSKTLDAHRDANLRRKEEIIRLLRIKSI